MALQWRQASCPQQHIFKFFDVPLKSCSYKFKACNDRLPPQTREVRGVNSGCTKFYPAMTSDKDKCTGFDL